MKTNRLFQTQIYKGLEIYIQEEFDKVPKLVYSSQEEKNGGKRVIYHPEKCINNCEKCYEDDEICEWKEYVPSEWLPNSIRHLGLIRILEIWGKQGIETEKIYIGLGLSGKINTQKSIEGMLGYLNANNLIFKNETGKWKFKGNYPFTKQFSRIKPLKERHIQECKNVAQKNHNDKK